ncbi:MAG TPA: TniB family NTP-binding protein [Devosia sp.]|jgi:hypothetical protein|nr:TniB family NTP-binding protein [Devosia sp.]
MTRLEDARALTATVEYGSAKHELKTLVVPTPQLDAVIHEVRKAHLQCANRLNQQLAWAPNNRSKVEGLLILGRPGSGKTFAVDEALNELTPLKVTGAPALMPSFVSLATPPSGTVASLAREVLDCMGTPMSRNMKPEDMLRKVPAAIVREKPTILHLDEVSRILNPDRLSARAMQRESQLFWSLCMAILDNPKWPVPVVMSAQPRAVQSFEIVDPTDDEQQTRRDAQRRLSILRLPDAGGQDAGFLEQVVQSYCDRLEVGNITVAADCIGHRLLHASDYALGHAMVIAQRAVALAHVRPRGKLKRQDFIHAYALWATAGPSANVFAVEDWQSIDTSRIAPRNAAEASFVTGSHDV